VTAPDGRRWKVRRLVLPRLRRRPSAEGLDIAAADAAILDAGLFGIAVLAVGILVLVFLPFVFFVLELLLLPLYILYRVVRGKPWIVEARSGSEVLRWAVRGWRRSGETVCQVARSLELGERPELPPASL
jgi:hypothetical protein